MSDLKQTPKALANFEGVLEHLKELILTGALDETEGMLAASIFDDVAQLYDRFTDRAIAQSAAQDPQGYAAKTAHIPESEETLEEIQERVKSRVLHDLQTSPLLEGGVALALRPGPKETLH